MSDISRYLQHPELTATQAREALVSELSEVTDKAASILNKAFQVKTIHDLAESPHFELVLEVASAALSFEKGVSLVWSRCQVERTELTLRENSLCHLLGSSTL